MGIVILGAPQASAQVAGGGPTGTPGAWAPTIQIDRQAAAAARAADFQSQLLIQRELNAMRQQELARQANEAQRQASNGAHGGGAAAGCGKCAHHQAEAGANAAQPAPTVDLTSAAAGGGSTHERAEPDEEPREPAAAEESGAAGAPAAPKNDPSREQIVAFVHWAARRFGLNETMLEKIAEFESSFKITAVNNWDSNARRGTPSKGLMQFVEGTFDIFNTKARKDVPEVFAPYGEPEWLDWRQQAITAAWAIANGRGKHWSTYERAKTAAGI